MILSVGLFGWGGTIFICFAVVGLGIIHSEIWALVEGARAAPASRERGDARA